jgi:hypothetical protein
VQFLRARARAYVPAHVHARMDFYGFPSRTLPSSLKPGFLRFPRLAILPRKGHGWE